MNSDNRMASNASPTESRRDSAADISGAKSKKFLNGWTKEQEQLMAEWSDVASCYRWLHDRAEKKYYQLNLGISIPVIILSTLTGAANFEKSEANRVASIAWGKFQRLLAVEIAINPMDRIDAMDFLKFCRQDLDRLIEQSPQIPDDIIKEFEVVFKHIPNLKVPDICHGIEHTRIFDSSKARLGKLAADAVLHLRYKKNILANSVMPNIDKKVEEELSTRIERRIKELLPSAPPTPPPEHAQDLTGIVTSLETDWRRLLTNRKLLLQTPPLHTEPQELADVRPEEIRLNVVGDDGPMAPTPSLPNSTEEEPPTTPAPIISPTVGFS